MDDLLERRGKTDGSGRRDRFRIGFGQMRDQGKSGGGGADEEALFLIADDVERLASPQCLDIDHDKSGADRLLSLGLLPTSQTPGTCQEQGDHEDQGSEKPED